MLDGVTPVPAEFAVPALGYDQPVMELVFHANAERVPGL